MEKANPNKAYLEHVAFKVKDIHWHIRFFREVLGMTLRDVDGDPGSPRQAWTFGGLQLMADPDFEGPEGRFAHLGVMCEDVDTAIEAAKSFGISHLDKGTNWLVLPDGLIVELIPASPGAVKAVLAIDPRAKGQPGMTPAKQRAKGQPGMTPAKQPHQRYYDDVKPGDEGITPEVIVTKEMIRTYADLTGDHTPVHVDEDFARASHFGGIVAHGLFGLSLADGLKTQGTLQFPPGASLGWNWDFLKPIRAGDRLHVKYRVDTMRVTKKAGWGIVNLASDLINQDGEVVQKGEHKLMILRRADAEQGALP